MTCTCQDYDPLCLHNHGGVDGRGDLVCQDCGASADCPHHGASGRGEHVAEAQATEAWIDEKHVGRGERSIYDPGDAA